jgi:phenylalanyl-tRNA synthetase beta chain
MYNGEEVGYLGKVSYEIQDSEDMRTAAYVMEINLEKLKDTFGNVPKFNPLPKFAEEKRDLALVMSKEVTCGEVEDCIKESCAYVTDVKLFDVYVGKPIPEDKKSMAFTVKFTPKDEEFTADSVDGFVATILKKLNKKLEIELRA